MKHLRVLAVPVLVAALSVASRAAADEAKRTAEDDRPTAHEIDKGKMLYGQHCLHCHGLNMVNPGTVTFDLRQFPRDQKNRFVESVRRGKSDRMPPWGDVL